MSFTSADRAVLEIREMLRKTRNREAVIRVIAQRGMEEETARELVNSIHRATLSANRWSALGAAWVGGIGVTLSLLVFFLSADSLSGRRLSIAAVGVGLPISAVALLWGLVKLCTASGYEVDED